MASFDPTGTDLIDGTTKQLAESPPIMSDVSHSDVSQPVTAEEPTTGGRIATEVVELRPPPTVVSAPALPLPVRNVSGTYVGISFGFELDLRVDVDGTHPMRRVSGDFVGISGATHTYFGSFVVDSPVITNTAAGEVIRGLGRFTFSVGAPVVQVTIPRRSLLLPAAPATVQFLTTANQPGAIYVCTYNSAYFRTVTLQTERVGDVAGAVLNSYNTGSLPSGGPARLLSVTSAYAEAGISMVPMPSGPVIDISEAGNNSLWSDAELLASMQKHFARVGMAPHWDMWQIACQQHEIGPGLYGIMFDSERRQGCAVFYAGIGGTTPSQQRLQLYTHVHELGHCFNLMHSWQKSFARPPGVDNPRALSWMNYPWNYPGGADAFWNAFPFQFADDELVHLRHAFRNNIVPSGNPFTVGAAEIDPALMADAIEDLSGLEFTIAPIHTNFYLGEPIVIKLRLRSFDRRGRVVHTNLHPQTSGVSVAIAGPDGRAVLFEPLVDHLVSTEPRYLLESEELSVSAYIGSGKRGLYFDRPGTYKVRAIYHALDGSRVLSDVANVRVRRPASTEDNEVAELMIGEEQGVLFALRGSDADDLKQGYDALKNVTVAHERHPLASYARYVIGVNAARAFKTVDSTSATRLRVRDPDLGYATTLLSAAAASTSRLDDLSKAQGLDRLAIAQTACDQKEAAARTAQASQQLRAAWRN